MVQTICGYPVSERREALRDCNLPIALRIVLWCPSYRSYVRGDKLPSPHVMTFVRNLRLVC